MKSLELDSGGRELEAGKQVLALEVGELSKEIVDAVACRQIFKHGLDGIAQTANHGLPVTHGRIDGDATKLAHAHDNTRIAVEGQGFRLALERPWSARFLVQPRRGEPGAAVTEKWPRIPREEREMVFERFRQGESSGVKPRGTGLGLAICREVMRYHAGAIWAEGPVEGGTRMVVVIPSLAALGGDVATT